MNLMGKSMETETRSEFPNGGKAIVEQILASEERQTLKSPKTKTLVEWSIERTSSMLDEIESKTVHKDEEDDK